MALRIMYSTLSTVCFPWSIFRQNHMHTCIMFSFLEGFSELIFKGGSSIGATGARPLFEILFMFVFVNFEFIKRIEFDFSQHAM